jgi:hypothetical protein
MRNTVVHLQRLAKERADEQARRIPWQRLFDARNEYIDWQEFYLWVRSILEVQERLPDSLAAILNKRCPGFLQAERTLTPKAAKDRPLALRLEDWIDEHIFGFVRKEGWFNAVTYYAVRDPRFQRAEVCWSECVEKWKEAKPIHYPSFEEWKGMASQCDDTAHLVASERRARSTCKLVDPARLAAAVSSASPIPAEVTHELGRRRPGFVDVMTGIREHRLKGSSQAWDRLMCWIADQFFQDTKTEGWFDAILIQVRSHPRAIRTVEYADHCDEIWRSQLPDPYPPFESWRRDADSYVEPPPE